MPSTRVERLLFAIAASFLMLLAGNVVAPRANADDRDLLRESSGDPYVFIVLDTSGSMHWSTICTQADLDAGKCNFLCPEGDCYVPLNGDDPGSKFYQAKEALYEVIRGVENVEFGFATYNQDQLRMQGKHWLYSLQPETPGITIPGSTAVFPPAGSTQVFGRPFDCTSGGDSIGHAANNPARFTDAWAIARTGRCAQLDQAGSADSTGTQLIYLRNPANTTTYRAEFRVKSGQTLGADEFDATLRLRRCNNGQCTNLTTIETKDLHYHLLSDFNSWDFGADRTNPRLGYFGQGSAADSPADNNSTCGGWDPNDDTAADLFNTASIKFPTTVDPNPLFRPHLNLGDVIPLDWRDDHRDEILTRLAPNRALGEPVPDFRTARYFEDRVDGTGTLPLKDSAARPLLAYGSTPLGFAVADFRAWWAGCEQGSCQGQTGWKDIAAANDPDWACRRKYLLVITDGDDTCPGRDPCSYTASLRAQENVFTYVVGFGVQNTPGNKLTCMAANGGTGEPILPQNKQDLIDVLTSIFGEIAEEARGFASAAVPSVQAEVADKIFLSSFTPLNDASVWDGHLDAFLKPLPLTEDGRPDKSVACSSLPAERQANCHLWDAGQVLLTQAPDQTEVDSDNLRLGPALDQRRVYYPAAKDLVTAATPNELVLFSPPTTPEGRRGLWEGMGLIYALPDFATAGSAPELQATNVIEKTLVEKNAVIDNEDGTTTPITYVLGDVFHSNPTVIDRPDDFSEFAANRYHGDTDADGQTCVAASTGYRCFARKHEFRRKMLAVGANDGMLHLFDAGTWDESEERFGNGTGTELFAFIPRMVLPIVKQLAERKSQIFSVDGSARIINVFIDPKHALGDPVNPQDRQWRTIAVGGLREGGSVNGGNLVALDNGKTFASGYFAIDITQPDRLNAANKPEPVSVVPTCVSGYSEAACGPVPFGAELWEFTDSVDGSPAEWGVSFDEDNNSAPDLGRTWSQVVIGRILIADGSGGTNERWVAIFGGGFDPDNPQPLSGFWLYMVDLETGQALYKRRVEGAVPSTPAVIDVNNDGILDFIYFGTTAGFLYKVDLTVPQPLVAFDARDRNDIMHSVQRITDVAWEPFKIFDTLADGHRLPIFFPPTVLVVAETGQLALAFGVGDREELWALQGLEGRFFIISDENFTRTSTGLPKLETNYTLIDSEGATNSSENFLLRPSAGNGRGFGITLNPDERIVAPAFSISGLTVFSTFEPQVVVDATGVCARTGDSRIFVVFSTNGDPILPPDTEGSTALRYMEVGDSLVTPPFVDQGATGNPGEEIRPPDETNWREAVMDKLKELFPPRCKYAGYTVEVNFLRSDTGVVRSIPVPICVVPKNWKEF